MTAPSFVRGLLGLCLVALFVPLAGAADPPKDAKKKAAANDPPGTETLMAEFRKWFKEHANKDDNTIGKIEAAKAFGYSRPYDAPPLATAPTGSKPAAKPKDDAEKPATTSTGGTGDGEQGKAPLSSYKNRPDYLFIVKLDKNNDEKVSQDEFETWAHDYVVAYLKEIEREKKAAEDAKKKYMQPRRPPVHHITNAFRRR